ncbi:protein of unknown function (DUF4157) [Streptomyces noursei ATCC 11455]|uniref:eCIS core domain-containing protein n=1 Tax=Streptomyces noursei TaxID=1971 RepID=UPI00081C90D6|nr:protein of unknown function (DUF4157) [Streptomyces noursei ATCC 11455]
MALQRTVGNRAVTRILSDAGRPAAPQVQRAAASAEEATAAVQRSAVAEALRGPGQPLPPALRSEMEDRLGADFADVRLHTGAAARASAAQVGARAYTSGKKLPFLVDKGQKVTHYVDTTQLPADRPRLTDYTVVPTYQAGYLPPYIHRNLARTDRTIADAKAELATLQQQVPQDQSAIDDLTERIENEEEAVAWLKKNGPDLFPTAFTCTAEYWLASYDPKAPWIISRESQDLGAQA